MIDLKKFTNLRVGQKVRTTCCKRATTAIVSRSRTEMRGYCFVCGETPRLPMASSMAEDLASLTASTLQDAEETPLTTMPSTGIEWPKGTTKLLPMSARSWLASYSISPELSERLSMRWSMELGRLILPCFDTSGTLVYWQGRAIEKWRKPKYLSRESVQASSVTFDSVRSGIIPLNPDGLTVLVEDIVSAVRVGHVYPAQALLGTALTDGKLGALTAAGVREVATWFDSDAAGSKARASSSRRLPLVGVRVRHVRTDKDPKNYSNRQIEEIVTCHG